MTNKYDELMKAFETTVINYDEARIEIDKLFVQNSELEFQNIALLGALKGVYKEYADLLHTDLLKQIEQAIAKAEGE